jgi:hypothetical protein
MLEKMQQHLIMGIDPLVFFMNQWLVNKFLGVDSKMTTRFVPFRLVSNVFVRGVRQI